MTRRAPTGLAGRKDRTGYTHLLRDGKGSLEIPSLNTVLMTLLSGALQPSWLLDP
jgi:hypothetical protein